MNNPIYSRLLATLLIAGSYVNAAESDALAVPLANFESADADQSDALSLAEFEEFVNANAESDFGKSRKIRRFKAYKRAFEKVDADKDGQLSWAEFENAQ